MMPAVDDKYTNLTLKEIWASLKQLYQFKKIALETAVHWLKTLSQTFKTWVLTKLTLT